MIVRLYVGGLCLVRQRLGRVRIHLASSHPAQPPRETLASRPNRQCLIQDRRSQALLDSGCAVCHGNYLPSTGSTTATVFRFLSRGSFSLGNVTEASAKSGATLTWWGDTWNQSNSLSGGPAPSPFKGFLGTTSTTPPVCGGTWTTSTGNSATPPATVPSYMGVAVTTGVTKSGSTLSGRITKIVVVKTNPGYAASPVSTGTGTVVATYC
jgi:hypothetical protein